MDKKKTGTKEWSDISLNAGIGCPHNCRYCYGRYNMCIRYKKTTVDKWPTFVPNHNRIDRPAKKESGIIMFPTIHDITPGNLSECMTLIRKNLEIGNKMLIVSKAHYLCFKTMCEAFTDYKDQLEFRVTIGSTSDEVLKFWEPGAPSFESRYESLNFAYLCGYKTSVSAEPFLDQFPAYVHGACIGSVTESIWVGMMNKIDQRCDFTEVSGADMKEYVQPVRETHNQIFLKCMYELMKDYDKIKWKESIRDILGLE